MLQYYGTHGKTTFYVANICSVLIEPLKFEDVLHCFPQWQKDQMGIEHDQLLEIF